MSTLPPAQASRALRLLPTQAHAGQLDAHQAIARLAGRIVYALRPAPALAIAPQLSIDRDVGIKRLSQAVNGHDVQTIPRIAGRLDADSRYGIGRCGQRRCKDSRRGEPILG